jgi:eukaryotic-like serine/threonine-protein kinase
MIKRIIMLVPIILLSIAHLSLINSNNSIPYMNQQALAAQDSASRFPPNILIDSLNNIVMTNRKEASFSLYENPIYGIKILYPASWDKLEFGLSADGLIAGFVLPKEGKPPSEINVSDFVLENIMIGVKSIPSFPSLSKNTILNDFVNKQISSYKQGLTDFQIVKSNTTAIDNNPAYQIQYTDKHGRATFDTLQIWTINGNKIYTILFNADPADYQTYLPIIQKMTDSFAILNNNKNNSHNQLKFRNV